ncbi:MAG: putative inorganic carbon transporter subunit DabA [Nitrospiria bacterium]
MNKKTKVIYNDSARMGLRGLVRIASEINSTLWPMRSFVTNNPLHSLEYRDFEEAIDLGRERLDGKGYLSNSLYREYFKSGRILPEDIENVLKPLTQDKSIRIGDRELGQGEVLRAQLLSPLSPPKTETADILRLYALDAAGLERLAERLRRSLKQNLSLNALPKHER